MKVIQINVVYDKGSTGTIMCNIHTELLNEGIESIICYGRGEKLFEKDLYKTCGELYSKINNLASRITGLMYGGCFWSTGKLISIIKKLRPDVVHLHCLNGYFVNIYRLVSWLKKRKIKTVLTLHAEFMHTANCGHAFECDKWLDGCGKCPRLKQETKSILFDRTHNSWMRMKKAFDGFETITAVSVSPWLGERAKRSPILKDAKHITILNGLDTKKFCVNDSSELRKALGIKDEKVIFHATPWFCNDIDNIKGGYYVLKLAEELRDRNIKIFVAGAYDESIKIPDNVIMLGRVSDQTLLARYYSMADVTVITSKRETFSMIVAESLCCGTPVVGFEAGGPESISIPEYSRFVKYGDTESLKNEVIRVLEDEMPKAVVSRLACDKYSKENMVKNYMEAYLN